MRAAARNPDVTASRHRAADVIAAVLANMRENSEQLRYSVLVPSRYVVVLSRQEYARLEGVLPRVKAETSRALDEELDRLNRPPWWRRRLGRWAASSRPALENAERSWHVDVLPDVEAELREDGDIVVHSELRLPADDELAGERTRRLTTSRIGGAHAARVVEARRAAPAAEPLATARLTYTDSAGAHVHEVTRDSITIGRGGTRYPVDVKITASDDVSREHARLRRDPATGTFYLIDLSSLGTTLNGRHVPRGFDADDGAKRENGVESPLPKSARIGLADVVFIDFERLV
jgi:hypothetical protein